jgi:hypothetical protein
MINLFENCSLIGNVAELGWSSANRIYVLSLILPSSYGARLRLNYVNFWFRKEREFESHRYQDFFLFLYIPFWYSFVDSFTRYRF